MDSSVQGNVGQPNELCASGPSLRVIESAPEPTTAEFEALHFEAPPTGLIRIERVEANALIRYQPAWADLCARTIEPNIFLEPGFALPLFQHVRYPKRPSFLLVWEGEAHFGRLLGLFPVKLSQGRTPFARIARGYWHEQTSCGAPLVDRDRAAEILDAVLIWLRARADRIDGLVFTNLVKDGPFHAEVCRLAAASSRTLVILGEHKRAVLHHRVDGPSTAVLLASAKRRKERGRQYRRLSEVGARTYTSARTPAEVAAATERFLALEHNGWKGARGTALLVDPTLATFARTMARLMAHEGKCRIDSIEIDGKPVAMGVVITSGGRAHFWKTTFDETYAPLSPGVQFAMELTRVQLADPTVSITDSCAVADHPMIDRLWPDRLAIADIMVAVDPDDTQHFARSAWWERLRRGARRRAKAVWVGLRHLRGD